MKCHKTDELEETNHSVYTMVDEERIIHG